MQQNSEILLESTVDEKKALDVIQEQIKENSLLIYMKGNATLPQCGFSAQVIEIFNKLGAKYKTFNILNHYPIREGIKKFSNWPTIPHSLIYKAHRKQFFAKINSKSLGQQKPSKTDFKRKQLKFFLSRS